MQQGTTTIVFALATTAISTIAAYYLKSAVVLEQELEFSASGLKSFVVATLTKVETYIAISCYVAALFLAAVSLSKSAMSTYMPMFFGLNVVAMVLTGVIFFGESLSINKSIGVVCLFFGVFLISR